MTYAFISIPSTFPPSLRPIYLHPIAPMSRKNESTSIPKITEAITTILNTRPGRILIHTVSYDLTRYLATHLPVTRSLYSYTSSADKPRAIDLYLHDPDGVLLAPSLDRGIDLPEDNCRHIIVPKIPFPNLGDKQISARLHSTGGSLWYAVTTIRTLVQMTGRGMRSETDQCNSYILDTAFINNIWDRSKHLLPVWWKDALVWDAGGL
jgi:ATP-dependent DNA helicase DinG